MRYLQQSKLTHALLQDPVQQTGFLQVKAIQDILNKTWFSKATDDGIIHNHYFTNPSIPLPTVALIATAVSCLSLGQRLSELTFTLSRSRMSSMNGKQANTQRFRLAQQRIETSTK